MGRLRSGFAEGRLCRGRVPALRSDGGILLQCLLRARKRLEARKTVIVIWQTRLIHRGGQKLFLTNMGLSI